MGGEGGLRAGWKATGSGVVMGGEERGGTVFAVGAWLWIRDGEKRGPVGARQENVPGVVGDSRRCEGREVGD